MFIPSIQLGFVACQDPLPVFQTTLVSDQDHIPHSPCLMRSPSLDCISDQLVPPGCPQECINFSLPLSLAFLLLLFQFIPQENDNWHVMSLWVVHKLLK